LAKKSSENCGMKFRKLSEHLALYLIESLKSLYELYAENKSFKFLLINNKQLTKTSNGRRSLID